VERNPPGVKKKLRQAQGFVCAVPGCLNPYLYYHHFDPPWEEQQHNEPDGMIALCGEHHPKADGGAFTKEQLRDYKRQAAEHAGEIKGRFDWLRHKIMIVSGGICHIENVIDVQIGNTPTMWFTRDDEGYARLNVRMPQSGPSKRIVIEDNDWIESGNVKDLVSPPGGKSLEAAYGNGDYLRIRFEELPDEAALRKHFPNAAGMLLGELPITSVEIELNVPGIGLTLHAGGVNTGHMILKQNYIGLHIG